MPLHLLSKKSWNIYNPATIARIEADEAAAAAEERAAEQRMQASDDARRMAILRGEEPPPEPPLESDEEEGEGGKDQKAGAGSGRSRRDAGVRPSRKRFGEDDTDFEMRVARERAEAAALARGRLDSSGDAGDARRASDAPIVDARGNIDLFGGSAQAAVVAAAVPIPEKNTVRRRPGDRGARDSSATADATEEAAADHDPTNGGLRFLDAAGHGQAAVQTLTGASAPWYAGHDDDDNGSADLVSSSTDVFGRSDPGRKARAAARIAADDPLAFMKSGARAVREVARERAREGEERGRMLREMRRDERRRDERRRDERRRERRSNRRRGEKDRRKEGDGDGEGEGGREKKNRDGGDNDNCRKEEGSDVGRHEASGQGRSERRLQGEGEGDERRSRHHHSRYRERDDGRMGRERSGDDYHHRKDRSRERRRSRSPRRDRDRAEGRGGIDDGERRRHGSPHRHRHRHHRRSEEVR